MRGDTTLYGGASTVVISFASRRKLVDGKSNSRSAATPGRHLALLTEEGRSGSLEFSKQNACAPFAAVLDLQMICIRQMAGFEGLLADRFVFLRLGNRSCMRIREPIKERRAEGRGELSLVIHTGRS